MSGAKFERLLSTILTVAACLIAVVLVRREFWPQQQLRTSAAISPLQEPVFQKDWKEWAGEGVLIGKANAPVTVVEFSDFECPFCQRFSNQWKQLKAEMGDSIALVYFHYPIRSHRFARPAARAAECANVQGKFAEFHDVLFEKQDSLGLKSWDSFASESGISDSAQFSICVKSQSPVLRIDANVARSESLHVKATPSSMINGWLYPRIPSDSVFQSEIRRRLREVTGVVAQR